jgi:signal transduction histidine kinase
MSRAQEFRQWLHDYSVSISWSLVLALLIVKALLTYTNFQAVVASSEQMQAQYDRLLLTQKLLAALDDAETGQRGYILTMEQAFLAPFLQAQARLNGILAEFREKSVGHPESLFAADQLDRLIALKMKDLKEELEIRRWRGFEAARHRITQGMGKKYMDDIRALIQQREERQLAVLSQLRDRVNDNRFRALAMLIAGSVLIIAMAIAAFALVRRQLKFRATMEGQLRLANNELEHRVAQRTEALLTTNEQLQQEVEERKRLQSEATQFAEALQRSNRELEMFASVASHDLQEPLRKIQAFSDRLTTRYREQLDDNGKEYLTRIQDSSGRMRQLIEDLLAYSRVSTKGRPFTPVNLNTIVKEVAGLIEVRLHETSAQLTAGDLPTIEADEFQMRQLFQNLIGNSLKFIRNDVNPVLTLSYIPLEWQGEPGCQITLTDNGIGFEQQYADRIFQLFQRLHGRSEYEGTGMGLAICRKIVERHQGKLEAFGEPGVGARFVIHLPLRQTTSESQDATSQ